MPIRELFLERWREGKHQFLPFIATVLAILFTDLLIGLLIGLAISIAFILRSNLRRPVHQIIEKHLSGDLLRIELANQVSFLNRASIEKVLMEVPRGGNILLDARSTVYIDHDILSLISDFVRNIAPAPPGKGQPRRFSCSVQARRLRAVCRLLQSRPQGTDDTLAGAGSTL